VRRACALECFAYLMFTILLSARAGAPARNSLGFHQRFCAFVYLLLYLLLLFLLLFLLGHRFLLRGECQRFLVCLLRRRGGFLLPLLLRRRGGEL